MNRKILSILYLSLVPLLFTGMAAGQIIQDFKWVGLEADKVGPDAAHYKPDKLKDGHFQLTLNLPSSMDVTRISIYSADEKAKSIGPPIWDTDPSTSWGYLGVFNGGRWLNSPPGAILGQFSGQVQFDLYCSDKGTFKPGKYFGVQVYLSKIALTKI